MHPSSHPVHVFVNRTRFSFEQAEQTGMSIKERAGIPLDHVLCLDKGHQHAHDSSPKHHGHDADDSGPKRHSGSEAVVIDNCTTITLQEGQRFFSVVVPVHGVVTVTINRKQYEFTDAHQTGTSLKERAGIPLGDVLFLDHPQEDEVITNDQKIALKCGDTFHSAPPANYGRAGYDLNTESVGFERFHVLPQPDGWTFLVIHDFPVTEAYAPDSVRLLLKLPPLFPEAAPDMFWVIPHVRTAGGAAPQGTSVEPILGEQWQRFSWHLLPGAWSPGSSTLRDFMRCVRARLEKKN